MSFLKSSSIIIIIIIIIIRCDFKSKSCISNVMGNPGLAGGRTGLSWCQVALVSLAYVLMLASCHLIISCAPCPQYIWLEPSPSYNTSWVKSSQSPAFSVILWFKDPVMLRFWVWQSSWQSSFLWDPDILMWPTPVILESCNPMILGLLQCLELVSPLRTMGLSGVFKSMVYQHRLERTQAAHQAGLLCPCSCCHRPFTIGLEQMSCYNHQWSWFLAW